MWATFGYPKWWRNWPLTDELLELFRRVTRQPVSLPGKSGNSCFENGGPWKKATSTIFCKNQAHVGNLSYSIYIHLFFSHVLLNVGIWDIFGVLLSLTHETYPSTNFVKTSEVATDFKSCLDRKSEHKKIAATFSDTLVPCSHLSRRYDAVCKEDIGRQCLNPTTVQ